MTLIQFRRNLKEFVSQAFPRNNDIESTEIYIELQPGMVSFGGQFNLSNRKEIPINLKEIGKLRCDNLRKDILSLHRLTTKNGRDKWNKATFELNKSGNVEYQFIWDEEFERINKQAHLENKELSRQKWYWDEK